jgi:hypothetical protein
MLRTTLRSIASWTVLVALGVALAPRLGASDRPKLAGRMVGRSLDAGGVYAGRMEIFIDQWSTEQERAKAIEAMGKGGPTALLEYLETLRVPKGYVQTPGIQNEGARALLPRSWTIEYAQDIQTKEGRRVIIASRSHLPIGEDARNVKRDLHQLNVVEIRFDKNGTGIGKIAFADTIAINKQTKGIEITKYDEQPTRIIDVTVQH